MKTIIHWQNKVVRVICYLYMLLFTYAAFGKLLDFVNFKVQLGQSPLLSAFVEYISWAVPVTELLIVVLLAIPRFRLIGLFASFSLMVMFTAYIYIILNYSSFIPCSCGGILEKLGWKEHLLFNVVFVLLAVIGILILRKREQEIYSSLSSKVTVASLFIATFCSIGLVVGLFLMSENITHYSNNFIRRFPHFPAVKTHDTNLQFNSFYIAGTDTDKVYLGSSTAQLLVTVFDSTLQKKTEFHIELDRKDLPFRAVTLRVEPPYFYVSDGTVPCVFKGNISDWKARLIKTGSEYFTLAEPIDSTTMIVRTQKRGSAESIIGRMNLQDDSETILNPKILEKQIDGLFDTDGHLVYSKQLKRFVYLYAYRNQFTVADRNLTIDFRGNTIDTMSHAKLEIVTIDNHGVKKLGKPALIVNKGCSIFNNLLFINSGIPGRYESLKMWKQASIIDLYSIPENSYLLSFYIYDEDEKKMKNFVVQDNLLYALIGNRLVSYKFRTSIATNYHKIAQNIK
ncbi:MauE/DoxX family redox-associated membrane protein [Flavobacterium sp. ZB4P13]|uniref:MauE/DoxX family redox-associated membrane protein n=1 Tax=Flavobacterium sp. ZB4P13 TaxID=3401728 RepID=UPI003AAF9A26